MLPLFFSVFCWGILGNQVRLCGYSNWKTEQIIVYVSDETAAECFDPRKQAMLKKAVCEHLSALVAYVFMHAKPSRPSQSRWTGVANVAQWTLGLALFHRFLKPLFTALSTKLDVPDADANSAGTTMDTDARDPSCYAFIAVSITMTMTRL